MNLPIQEFVMDVCSGLVRFLSATEKRQSLTTSTVRHNTPFMSLAVRIYLGEDSMSFWLAYLIGANEGKY